MSNHIEFMKIALSYAEKAYHDDEVPVGAVIVKDNSVISYGFNSREKNKDTLGHAEINAIKKANVKLNSWNLSDCTLYVTMEPCLMCTGAIKESRIDTIVYGCKDQKGGYLESNFSLAKKADIKIIGGVLETESRALLNSYFKDKRKQMIKIAKLEYDDLTDYFNVRKKVFVEEQGVSVDEEFDSLDKQEMFHVEHIAAKIDHQIVATMRIIYDDISSTVRIGRLAVLSSQRNKNIGSRLLAYAERQALARGYNKTTLSAQVRAKEFYNNNGYIEIGEIFDEAGIEHIKMVKKIK